MTTYVSDRRAEEDRRGWSWALHLVSINRGDVLLSRRAREELEEFMKSGICREL